MPSSRDFLLIGCSVACLLGLGVVMLGLGGETAAGAELEATDPRGAPVEAPVAPGQLNPVEVPFHKSERHAAQDAAPAQSARTDGLIRGDITLAASAVSRIQNVTVRIVEAKGEKATERPPFSRLVQVPFTPSDGTPKFSVDGIPFSPFGYTVEVFAPGLNGTAQVVHVDAGSPVADVILGIHPGVPFSLLLRDQDLAPLAGVDVTMQPDGAPDGRPTYTKTTDGYGAAVFQDVLRGTYQAHFGPLGQPLRAPEPVEVLAASGNQVQSRTVVIAKGESLTVNLFNTAGHGLADVEVKVSAGSDSRWREFKATTDWAGKVAFSHLPAGSYWINVIDPRFEPRTLPVVVRAGERPKDVDIRLSRH